MNVLISGYVPAEGRFSMVRAARAIQANLTPLLDAGDAVRLDESGVEPVADALDYRSLSVKLRKRLLMPLGLRWKPYDVLHVIDNDYAAGVPARCAARTVVTCHDMMPFLLHDRIEDAFPRRAGRTFYLRGLERMSACGRVVCDSQFTRRCVLEHTACLPERVEVIPLGVEPSFRPLGATRVGVFRERHSLTGKRVVLHVGSADPYKNLEAVFRVVSSLRRALGDSVMLLKVGGRFSAAQETLMSQLGLRDAIVHATGLSEEELVTAYNAADVLLWPSRFEGFGLPVLEAMACGTPVVCSNGGSLAEVAGDAACVHDAEDEDRLRASCARVLEDIAFADKLREAGAAQVAAYSWERTAAAYYVVYRRVHGESGHGRV
ncbi:MAG TPA: glycosyltransferase family 1 protein [Candidatus Hydrogenedentes bacterium]|nr:glycosyltransferase family 1 protein [Candidatus Hydrogenedentota bacterium]HPG69035.1 glycosyltransferase family 1 protein [Candidatus Hydrogenedentota bacterium]